MSKLKYHTFDRYMQERADKIPRKKLQLVGVTSMFIAAKYEEMYAPEIGKQKSLNNIRDVPYFSLTYILYIINIFYLKPKR